MRTFRLSSLEEDTRVLLVEGLVVLKGDLTTVSTTGEKHPVEELSVVLEGEKEEGSGSIPARQTAGKTIGGRVLLRLNAKVWKLSWLHGESGSRNPKVK